MKIDIGNGKVLGTKRVSPNGQISGFTEYAGQEVLVVLPGGETDVKLTPRDLVREVQVATNEHMKVAFHQYKELRHRFETPERATKDFLNKYAPRSFQGLYDKVEEWTTEQLDRAEERIELALTNGDGQPDAKPAEGEKAAAPSKEGAQ